MPQVAEHALLSCLFFRQPDDDEKKSWKRIRQELGLRNLTLHPLRKRSVAGSYHPDNRVSEAGDRVAGQASLSYIAPRTPCMGGPRPPRTSCCEPDSHSSMRNRDRIALLDPTQPTAAADQAPPRCTPRIAIGDIGRSAKRDPASVLRRPTRAGVRWARGCVIPSVELTRRLGAVFWPGVASPRRPTRRPSICVAALRGGEALLRPRSEPYERPTCRLEP